MDDSLKIEISPVIDLKDLYKYVKSDFIQEIIDEAAMSEAHMKNTNLMITPSTIKNDNRSNKNLKIFDEDFKKALIISKKKYRAIWWKKYGLPTILTVMMIFATIIPSCTKSDNTINNTSQIVLQFGK